MLLIGVAGPSESGKSHATQYIAAHCGTIRLKLVDVLREIYRDQIDEAGTGFKNWPFQIEQTDPDWLVGQLREWFCERLEWTSTSTVESLYGPRMSSILAKSIPGAYELWFITASRNTRVLRQREVAGLRSLQEAESMLATRDRLKIDAGLLELQVKADQEVVNDGSLLDLHRQLHACLERSRRSAGMHS